MQSPIREQIKLADPWHSRPVSDSEASVFVPGGWVGQQVVLVSESAALSTVRIGDTELAPSQPANGWPVGEHLTPGQWNQVAATLGAVAGARLVASNPLHIVRLEASDASAGSLSVRVGLSDAGAPAGRSAGGEPPCLRGTGLLNLFFTLTAANGKQVAGMEVTFGRRTRDLSVELLCSHPLSGPCRLKAALCTDELVIDNARTDLTV